MRALLLVGFFWRCVCEGAVMAGDKGVLGAVRRGRVTRGVV